MELSQDAKEALRLARRASEPDAAQLERIALSLRVSLEGVGAQPTPGPEGHPHSGEILRNGASATQSVTGLSKLAAFGKPLALALSTIGAGTLATWICLHVATPEVSAPERNAPVAPVSFARPEQPDQVEPLELSTPAGRGSPPGSEQAVEQSGDDRDFDKNDMLPGSDRLKVSHAKRVQRRKEIGKGGTERVGRFVEETPFGQAAEVPSAPSQAGAPREATAAPVERSAGGTGARSSADERDESDAVAATRDEPAIRADRPSSRAGATSNDSLAREIPIIARAHALLTNEKPKHALALLDSYFREFPQGTLRVEALTTRALCHCRLGAAHEARTALRSLAGEPAAKPHLLRLRAACQPLLDESDF
jgi:hypothetical protein